jgi:hypothetical protein
MATLGVLDELGRKYLERDVIALAVLPSLWKFALQPSLNAHQVCVSVRMYIYTYMRVCVCGRGTKRESE